MARAVDEEKKPLLLDRILDHLLDKPLSALSFRTLASALGVSTFTLVYHFGTRAELVSEIIGAIATRRRGFEDALAEGDFSMDTYLEVLQRIFDLGLQPRNRALQRLEFEAQMLESLTPRQNALTHAVHERLQSDSRNALIRMGLSENDATMESRLLIDTFYGVQVSLLVNRDDERAITAFDRALQHHRARILELAPPAPGG